jgi:hypothetical protein
MIMVEGSIDFFEIAVGALVLHLYLLIAELFLIQMHISLAHDGVICC